MVHDSLATDDLDLWICSLNIVTYHFDASNTSANLFSVDPCRIRKNLFWKPTEYRKFQGTFSYMSRWDKIIASVWASCPFYLAASLSVSIAIIDEWGDGAAMMSSLGRCTIQLLIHDLSPFGCYWWFEVSHFSVK